MKGLFPGLREKFVKFLQEILEAEEIGPSSSGDDEQEENLTEVRVENFINSPSQATRNSNSR